MLSKRTTAEQIDAWRAAESETENLEFKEAKIQFDFNTLLAYCVAIANEGGGVLLLGIANKLPRPVVGTNAYLNVVKTTEDLFNRLHFRVGVEAVQHPGGRVLVFHIPSRPIRHPCHVGGRYYVRSGESLVAMVPDQLRQIFYEQLAVIDGSATGLTGIRTEPLDFDELTGVLSRRRFARDLISFSARAIRCGQSVQSYQLVQKT